MLIQKAVHRGILCTVLLALALGIKAQCSFLFDLDITDNSSQVIDIEVSGLLNGDLSLNQAICGINLEFQHDYIGDLTIDLVSPSGQSITLIGQVTDMINPTNLATWDVTFVPCSETAIPDPGFQSIWNNNQMWEVFGNYSGSYFPHSGCFSDFNTGSANGVWQLVVDDQASPATGLFVSAEIIFCDDSGLSCSICPAHAGDFVLSAVDVCEGDPLPNNSFNITYPSDPPDPDTTNLTFLISDDSQPVVITPDPESFNWISGMYTVCALSYLESDSAQLFDLIDTMSISEILDVFENDLSDLCADLTDQCLDINIRQLPDTTVLNETICSGQSYFIAGQSFGEAGVYDIMLTTLSGCDSIVRLNLSIRDVVARIVQSDTLSCEMPTITLDAASSSVPGTPAYLWDAIGGAIIGPTTTSSVQISAPGTYSVTVTSLPSGCQDVRSLEVVTDGSQPEIFIDDEVIDCNNLSVILEPVVFPANVTFDWSGPGGFASNLRNPLVSEVGEYWLVATDPSGCSASVSVNVIADTSVSPEPTIQVSKNCNDQQTLLSASPSSLISISWSGPGGFASTNETVEIQVPGTYMLEGTYENGCTETAVIDVDLDYTVPNVMISATVDSLDCGENSILTASSTDQIDLYSWYSVFGVISDTSTITVVTPGEYLVEAVGVNGCPGFDTIEIAPAADLPQAMTFTDTLSCVVDTVTIGVVTLASIISYRWSGPGLVDSLADFVQVVTPGTYTVEMVEIAGCVLYAVLEVTGNYSAPSFSLESDTITCARDSVELFYTTTDMITGVSWQVNNIDIGSEDTILVTEPGIYTLALTGENGCTTSDSYSVPFDTLGPEVYIEPTDFGCEDSVRIDLSPIDPLISTKWSGPASFTSMAEDPYVREPGLYTLEATGNNGCTTIRNVDVRLNAVVPDYELEGELFDCIDSLAVFSASSTDTTAEFAWYDTTNTLIADSNDVELSSPGTYTLVVTGYNKCQSMDTFTVEPPSTPPIFAEDDTINCRDDEVILLARSDSSMMSFEWFDSNGEFIIAEAELQVSQPGMYSVVGTWTNGCTSDTTIQVYIDTVPPIAVATTDERIKCDVREINISGAASLGDSLDYDWEAVSGTILLGDDRDTAFARGPGVFVLTVVESINHCEDSDTLEVVELPNTLEAIELTIVPECQGNGAGAIIVDSVLFADSPLQYSIGPNSTSASPIFDSLLQGEYRLSIIDSFGCRLDTIVFITETSSETTVDLGPDREILLGGMTELQAVLDVDSSEVGEIFWEPALECDSCLSNTVSPVMTTDYVIYVRDPFGCLTMDDVRVYVVERGQVYVPNIFTPNGDGKNDFLTVRAHPGVALIDEFSIYDRWGNLMFGVEDVVPQTEAIEWDGTYNGTTLNPAVYTYVMRVELITGREEIHTGDITLLR